MRKTLLLMALAAFTAGSLAAADTTTRTFDATYTATINNLPTGAGVLDVWIPLPVTREEQIISDVKIDSPYDWKEGVEGEFGDHYAFARIPVPQTGQITVRVQFTGTRRPVEFQRISDVAPTAGELQRALKADKLVTVSPRIHKHTRKITSGKQTTLDQAQAIYEYVVTHMKYDKTIPGWGHGDTERACDIHAGNCTDFHSLFISLARARGIPARFAIGFPLPKTSDGTISGYHCWAEFYLKGRGWIPVDASEASQSSDPAVRAFLFGNQSTDRVEFTRGRDLVLSPKTSEPVNFLIYPRVELHGKAVGNMSLSLQVHDRKGGEGMSTSMQ